MRELCQFLTPPPPLPHPAPFAWSGQRMLTDPPQLGHGTRAEFHARGWEHQTRFRNSFIPQYLAHVTMVLGLDVFQICCYT